MEKPKKTRINKNSKDKEKLIEKELKLQKKLKKQEEEREDLEEWKNLLIKECQDFTYGAILIAANHKIQYINDYALSYFQYSAEELINSDINMLLYPQHRDRHNKFIYNFFKNNTNMYVLKQMKAFIGMTRENTEIYVKNHLALRKKSIGNKEYSFCLCFIELCEPQFDLFLVLPHHPFYMVWIGFMFAIISYTMILLPYNFVFDRSENLILNITLYVSTFFDILFNFNCAYVENNQVVTTRSSIAKNYLSTYFIIDLQTGIPVEFLENIIPYDIVMAFKFLRSVKLVKYYSALTNDYIIQLLSRSFVFKEIKQVINKYYFMYEVVLFFCVMLVVVHYLTTFWVYVAINTDQHESWLFMSGVFNNNLTVVKQIGTQLFYYDDTAIDMNFWVPYDPNMNADPRIYIKNNPWTSYIDSYYVICSSFLGYQKLSVFNSNEKRLSVIIMMLGLLFIAYLIGRISQLLSKVFRENYVYNKTYKSLYHSMEECSISDDLIDKVLEDLQTNLMRMNYPNLHDLEPVLSKKLYSNLLQDYYKGFLQKHLFFRKLPLEYIHEFQRYCVPKYFKKVYEIYKPALNLYFLHKGHIKLYDQYGNVYHQYDENEIIGFKQFLHYIKTKITNIDNQYSNQLNKTKSNDTPESPVSTICAKRSRVGESNKMNYNHNAYADPDSTYYVISFIVLEQLIRHDKQIFKCIEEYKENEFEPYNRVDIQYTENEMNTFNKFDLMGIIFLNTGIIYKVNKAFNNMFPFESNSDYGFYKIILKRDKNRYRDISQINNGPHLLKMLDKDINIDIAYSVKSLVLPKKRLINGVNTEVTRKREVYIIYFKMIDSVSMFLYNKMNAVQNLSNIVEINISGGENDEHKKEFELKYNSVLDELNDNNISVTEIFKKIKRGRHKRNRSRGDAYKVLTQEEPVGDIQDLSKKDQKDINSSYLDPQNNINLNIRNSFAKNFLNKSNQNIISTGIKKYMSNNNNVV